MWESACNFNIIRTTFEFDIRKKTLFDLFLGTHPCANFLGVFFHISRSFSDG
jgi:hypothetical protein